MTRSAVLGIGAVAVLALCVVSLWHLRAPQVLPYLAIMAVIGAAIAWLLRDLELRQDAISTGALRQRLAEVTRERDLAQGVAAARDWHEPGGARIEGQLLDPAGQLETLGRERLRLQQVRSDLESRLTACQADLDTARTRARDLAPLPAYLAQRDETIRQLEASLVARGVEYDGVRDELSLREEQIRTLAARVAGLERDRDSAAAAHRAATASLVATHQAAIEGRAAGEEELRARLAERDRQLGAARERIAEEVGARERLQARLGELEPVTARVRELEQRLAEGELRRLASVRDMESEVRALRALVAESRAGDAPPPATAGPVATPAAAAAGRPSRRPRHPGA
jgi:chromosome segregation ATPase